MPRGGRRDTAGRLARSGLGLALPVLLVACAVGPSPARVAALNATIGMSEADLVRAYGVPTRSIDADGHRFLAYVQSHTTIIPGSGGWPGWGWPGWGWGPGWGGFPPEVVEYSCETTFELTKSRVVSWNLRGNDCR